MNHFLNQSIELANQRDYLDQLFRAYGNIKDRILFYVKSNQYIWNEVYEEITKN